MSFNKPHSHKLTKPSLDPTLIQKIVFGNQISADLYDSTPEAIAQHIGTNEKGEARKGKVKSTQARRFYDEVVMWDEKIRQNPASFAENLPLIKMIKAKASYSRGRELIDDDFLAVLVQGLKQVNDAKTLHQFKLFFEAFMGFYKVHGPNA